MKQWFLFSWLLVAAGMIACNKDSDSSIPDTSAAINVFLAVPDAKFDVLLDTVSIGSDLGMGESTGYHKFRAQRYTLYIYPAGNRTTPVAGGQVSLRNNHYSSVFLSRDNNKVLRAMIVEDDLKPPTTANTGKLRIVNLSDTYASTFQTLRLDFYVDSSLRYQRINYLNATDFQEIPIGAHTRDVRWADSSLSLLQNNLPDFTVEDRKIYSWIAIGNALVKDSFKLVEFVHER